MGTELETPKPPQVVQRVHLSVQEWSDITDYVTSITTPYPLIELAYKAKLAMQNAKIGTLTIPAATATANDTPPEKEVDDKKEGA